MDGVVIDPPNKVLTLDLSRRRAAERVEHQATRPPVATPFSDRGGQAVASPVEVVASALQYILAPNKLSTSSDKQGDIEQQVRLAFDLSPSADLASVVNGLKAEAFNAVWTSSTTPPLVKPDFGRLNNIEIGVNRKGKIEVTLDPGHIKESGYFAVLADLKLLTALVDNLVQNQSESGDPSALTFISHPLDGAKIKIKGSNANNLLPRGYEGSDHLSFFKLGPDFQFIRHNGGFVPFLAGLPLREDLNQKAYRIGEEGQPAYLDSLVINPEWSANHSKSLALAISNSGFLASGLATAAFNKLGNQLDKYILTIEQALRNISHEAGYPLKTHGVRLIYPQSRKKGEPIVLPDSFAHGAVIDSFFNLRDSSSVDPASRLVIGNPHLLRAKDSEFPVWAAHRAAQWVFAGAMTMGDRGHIPLPDEMSDVIPQTRYPDL